MNIRWNSIREIAFTGMLAVTILSSGCSQKKGDNTEQTPEFAVSCVAVAPAVSVPSLDSELLSQIERKELEDGLYYTNEILKKYFLSRKDVRLFSDGNFGDDEDASVRPSLERAKSYADKLSCNTVLETSIHRYKERVGGNMTAKEPASVAFAYRLLAMPNGEVLCQDSFDAEQQSMLENLLSFHEGTGGSLTWLSGKDFLNKGLRNRLGKCAYLAEEK